MTWNIGASTGCCHHTPIVQVVRALADVGMATLEIGTPPGHFDIWQRSQVTAIKHELRATGIRAYAIHAPFGGMLDLSDPNPRHRHAGLAAILTAAEILHELGGDIVVIHASDVHASVPDAAARLGHACASVATLQRACHDMRMRLALESPLGHLIGGTPDQFARLLESAGPDATVCLDTGHTWLGHRWHAFAALARGRLIHVHAHDNDGVFDDHKPPGDGRIHWRVVAETLRQMDYTGWMMLELACPTEPLPQYFSRAAQQLLLLLQGENQEQRTKN
jgi:sugar phosphate isomerase/epimerase